MLIRSLTIERYRGLERLEWHPTGRVNCLIGPGDAGKSTVLSAIELVLDPRPSPTISEYDYFRRRVHMGFQITAVLGDLDERAVAAMRTPPLQGWLEGELRPLPDEDGVEPVLVARVIASPELELSHVLVAPNEADEVAFSVANRRRLLLSRVVSGVGAGTDFRLGRGSLLERHASATDLRAALRTAVADASARLELPAPAAEALLRLRTLFTDAGLPNDLHLSIISPQGWSLLSLVGLLEGVNAEVAVPLALAGSGTRQLALFQLAMALMDGSPVVLVDEPELGLEPYRQRRLVTAIRTAIGEHGQAFLTTHSPAVLDALNIEEISRLALGGQPVALCDVHIGRVQKQAPDALLARLPVLCEGDTEAGLLMSVLNNFAREDNLPDLDSLGIRLVARTGQPAILDEADKLLHSGLACGLFVDNERDHVGRRANLARQPRCAFGTWHGVRNIEEAVAKWMPWDRLADVVDLAAELRGRIATALLQQVGECIGRPGTTSLADLRPEFGEASVRDALGAAMQTGTWFKSMEGGGTLGKFLLEVGPPPEIEEALRAFWQRVRQESGWA